MSEQKAPIPNVIQADRVGDGLVIEFDNGRCALYSKTLLYAMFPSAVELRDDLPESDENESGSGLPGYRPR